MDKIIEALGKILPTIGDNVFASLVVITVLLGFGTYTLMSKNFAWFADNWFKPTMQQDHFTQTLTNGRQIQSSLDRTLGFCSADRVCLFEFHNGLENLGGIPFMSSKLTYIALKPGVDITPELMAHSTPMSAFVDFTERVWNNPQSPKVVKLASADLKHQLMKAIHSNNGCEFAFAAPVCDTYGNAVGMITVEYNRKADGEAQDDLEIAHKLGTLGMEICGHMRNIKGKRKFFPFNR